VAKNNNSGQTQGEHLQAKFHMNVFTVSASVGQKPQFLANFDIFGGFCTDHLLPMSAKFGVLQQTHGVGLPAKFRLDQFILSSCGGKNANICVFWTSAFSDVANWHQAQKVEHGCTATNLPRSNGIKIVPVLQRLHGEIGRTNSDIQKRDGQTDRQKKLNVFGHPGGG